MRGESVGTWGMTLSCLVVFMAGTAHSDEPQTPFQVKSRKAHDRVLVRFQGDRTLITVTSPSGIGGATITRQGERWPGGIVLRLRLSGMERLQIRNGQVGLS